LEQKKQKYMKITLLTSIAMALVGATMGAWLFKAFVAIGVFFGLILGFFTPWMVALIGYSLYAMSNPLEAFKDDLKKLEERSQP